MIDGSETEITIEEIDDGPDRLGIEIGTQDGATQI